MKLVALVMLPALIGSAAFAQTSVTSAAQTSKPAASKSPTKKQGEEPTKDLFGGGSKIEGPITTEIYADEAFFDSNKNVGVFTGHVKVLDPRFSVQSDKLTVYLRKGQDQGLERAVADGNVGVVRERPDPNTGQPTRAIGRSDHAVYTASDGNVELTGTPRVQQGPNMHVATSADTVMLINQNGQLTTHGPSRTEIHQEAKEEKPGTQPKG
jgi:lipopolysaccharide transport protein LptA